MRKNRKDKKMEAIYSITLDLHSTVSQASLAARQGDTDRELHIMLRESGENYALEKGSYVVLSTVTPKGNDICDYCVINHNVIVYKFTPELVASCGVMDIDVSVYDANDKLITAPVFTLVVTARANVSEKVEKSDSYTALDKLFLRTNSLKNVIENKLKNGEFNGVGIESIEQTEYGLADGAANVMTVVLSNGETRKFTVHNGNKGNPGRKGDDGLDGISVTDIKYIESTDDGGINFLTLERTFGDGTVKETVVPIRNGKTGRSAGFGEITTEAKTINIDSQPTVSIKTSGENDAKNFHFDFGIPSDKQSFANAIQNTVTGSIVSLTDISPLEHTLSVKARSDNLIDFLRPATETRLSYCTLNEDGKTITSKFTDDYYSSISLYYLGDFLLKNKGKTITFSVKESYSDVSLAIVIHGDMTTGATYQSDNTPNGATSLSLKISEDFTKISRIELRFNRSGVPFTTDREFTEFKLAFDTKATPYTPFVPIGSISKSYTIEADAKEYISIVDIDKCIAKSRAEGRTYASGKESFEIRFSSEGDGFYRIDDWQGSEAELLNQWGISMLQPPEADKDSYRFRLFYKDGTNIKAVVAGKNFAQVNSLKTPTSEKTIIFSGEITGDFVFSCNINCECTNMGGTMFGVTIDGKEKDITPYAIIGNPNGYPLSGTITQIEFINYSVCKEGSIDNIQLEPGTIKTDFEPHNKLTTHSINADGTVEGVTSIYPTTVITSDTEGVVFDVGYNVDSKKYIDAKFAELAALIVNS